MRKNPITRSVLVAGSLAALAGFVYFAVQPAYALTIVPSCATAAGPNPPSLACAVQTFRNVASLIVGVTGSFALLMFVYGGFMLLTSAGVESRVTTGKTIIRNAVIGMVLIFTAGYIIDYAVLRLASGSKFIAEGQSCNDLRGVYRQVPNRGLVCVTQCTAMGADNYSCMPAPDPGAPDPRTGCNSDYVCGTGLTCCSVGCTTNAQCSAGQTCDPVYRNCVSPPETTPPPDATTGGGL